MKNTTIQLNGNTYYGQINGEFFYFNEYDRLEMGVDKIRISAQETKEEKLERYKSEYDMAKKNKQDNVAKQIKKEINELEKNVKSKKISAREKNFLSEDAELLCDNCIVKWDGKKLTFEGASADANFYYEGKEVFFDHEGEPYVMPNSQLEPLPSKEIIKKPSDIQEEQEEESKDEKEKTEERQETEEMSRSNIEEQPSKEKDYKKEDEIIKDTSDEVNKSVNELVQLKKDIREE